MTRFLTIVVLISAIKVAWFDIHVHHEAPAPVEVQPQPVKTKSLHKVDTVEDDEMMKPSHRTRMENQ